MGDSKKSVMGGNVGFIGAGNMAWAIGAALVKTGVVQPSQIFVSAPSDRNLGRWKEIGVNTTEKNGVVVEKADFIFLAVKPFKLDEALEDTRKSLETRSSDKLFVSLLAGVKVNAIHRKVNDVVPRSRVIRVMPNTPVMVGAGISVFCRGPSASEGDVQTVRCLLSVGGLCEELPEQLMDAVTGVSGCGPAYIKGWILVVYGTSVHTHVNRITMIRIVCVDVCGTGVVCSLVTDRDVGVEKPSKMPCGLCMSNHYGDPINHQNPAPRLQVVFIMIEAMADGAVKMGVPRATALNFAAQTVMGAAKMVLETGKHPGQLKDEVCSPGGATITGVHALEKAGIRGTLMDAVEAATKRAIELGE